MYMISEITRGVSRLHGPMGSCGLATTVTPGMGVGPKLTNWATVPAPGLALLAVSPRYTVLPIAMVAAPSGFQFTPS